MTISLFLFAVGVLCNLMFFFKKFFFIFRFLFFWPSYDMRDLSSSTRDQACLNHWTTWDVLAKHFRNRELHVIAAAGGGHMDTRKAVPMGLLFT